MHSGVSIYYNHGGLVVDGNTGYINPMISSGPTTPGLSGNTLSMYTYPEIKDMYIYVFRYPTYNSYADAAVYSTVSIKNIQTEPVMDIGHFMNYSGVYK